MIGFLKGSVLFKPTDEEPLLVEVRGVGYAIRVSASAQIKEGDFVSLWIYTALRQDSLELYGFFSLKEKQFFLSLLKVSGIGPKMALGILSACSVDSLAEMIHNENIKALCALPKVGKKTARHIVLSLKDSLSSSLTGLLPAEDPYGDQLFSALSHLGFNSIEIRETLLKIKFKKDLKQDIKQALSLLKPS